VHNPKTRGLYKARPPHKIEPMQTPRAPQRRFTHGEAGATEGYELVDRPATDRGTMLICIEFLSRYASDNYTVLFTEYPRFIKALATLFPKLQFYVFGQDQVEYDPENPGFDNAKNIVVMDTPFTTEYALHLGKRDRSENLLLICHQDRNRLLVNHAMMSPNWSLLALTNPGQDFFEGELYYPIHSPKDSRFAYIVVSKTARAKTYDPVLFQEELAFFHAITRNSAYDEQAETAVLHQFANNVLKEQGDRAWLAAEQTRCFLPQAGADLSLN
jgi:hypothetical protein